jgi:glycosyltransferase involved in cell wall biosynthesis
VAAAPGILRAHPAAEFVVAGPDEGELAPVRALAAELGLAHKVTFPGPLTGEQMLTELRRAHVYVLPSVAEPFPMSVLEAMAVGTPVVVTRSNGLARDVECAAAGRVVADAAGIAPAVLDLLDPDTRRAASRAAHALTAEAFSMDAVLDTLLETYQRSRTEPGAAMDATA